MREPSGDLLKSWNAEQTKPTVRVPQTLDEVYNGTFPFRYDWAEALNKQPS